MLKNQGYDTVSLHPFDLNAPHADSANAFQTFQFEIYQTLLYTTMSKVWNLSQSLWIAICHFLNSEFMIFNFFPDDQQNVVSALERLHVNQIMDPNDFGDLWHLHTC